MQNPFSKDPGNYSKFRPAYPTELFTIINTLVKNKQNCWDCGTGNGQIASELSKDFDTVYATDISRNQISQAKKIDNVHYSLQPAEKATFENDFFDLVVVGQAIHWFDFNKFYLEVERTCKPNSIIAVVGYGLFNVNTGVDEIINNFYTQTLGAFWDPERKYIDDAYQTIPFPFEEIKFPKISMKYQWDLKHLIGFLNTWSAVKHYFAKNGNNPTEDLFKLLNNNWQENEIKTVEFPILLRIGKVNV